MSHLSASESVVNPRADAPEFSAALPADRPVDGRVVVDRRQRPTPMFSRHAWFGGRRHSGGRRPGENEAIFVDMHGSRTLLVVLAIVLLNFLDAWFTVLFLSHGGQEMNPIVDSVLQWGPNAFALLKSLGIGACVVALTLARRFRIARVGLMVILVGYSLLLGWHLLLLTRLPV